MLVDDYIMGSALADATDGMVSSAEATRQQKKQRNEELKQKRFMKGFGMLIGGNTVEQLGGIIGGNFGGYMQQMGSSIQSGTQGFLTGQMMGLGTGASGALGMTFAVTAAYSSWKNEMDAFAETVKRASKTIEASMDALHAKSEGIRETMRQTYHERQAEMLGKDQANTPYVSQLAREWRQKANQARDNYLKMEDPREMEARVKATAEERKRKLDEYLDDYSAYQFMEGLYGILPGFEQGMTRQNARNIIDQKAVEEIKAYQDRYTEQEKLMRSNSSIASMYEGAQTKLESERKSDMDRRKREEEKKAAEDRMRSGLLYGNDTSIAGYVAQARALGIQGAANDILNNKTLGPLGQFQQISEMLDIARG